MPKATDAASTELPVVCEVCLGDKDFVRMTRDVRGAKCKLCERPYVVFSWLPGHGQRRATTKICRSCSRKKGACQSCILDLTYRLPLNIRDTALGLTATVGVDTISKKYIGDAFDESGGQTSDDVRARGQHLLKQLADARDKQMPKAPEAVSGGSAIETIRALPITGTIRNGPDDLASLFIMGIEPDLDDQHLRSHLNKFADLEDLRVYRGARCGFVTFRGPKEAQQAAQKLEQTNGSLVVDGNRMKLVWGAPVTIGPQVQDKIGPVIRRFLRTGKIPAEYTGRPADVGDKYDD